MKELLKAYEESCEKVMARIHQLTQERNLLRKNGDTDRIFELDLERRIKLLYVEHGELSEIVRHLSDYVRRVEKIAEA